MPTEATFRFSTYLTLALACVAVGYAQAPMLPEVPVFAGLAVAALGALYFLESRTALLSIPDANRLGGVVGAAFFVWVAYRVKRELDTGEFAHLGWPMLFVAMSGPLVLMLLAAKAARGEKHAGDYWALHGTALAGIGLAAAFAEEPLCFVLLGLYLVAAVWSLTLFHLARSAGHVPPVPDPAAAVARTAAASGEPHGSRTGFRAALLSAALAGAVAAPLYLLTPRSGAPKADFGTAVGEVGYAANQMVDLKTTGTLKSSTETAFEVTATYPDGAPKTDLSPDQRWRGRSHQLYTGGAWNRDAGLLPTITPRAKFEKPWEPPPLGPGQFKLEFAVPARADAYFVADPVLWVPHKPAPLAGLVEGGEPQCWTAGYDGSFFWEPPQPQPRGAQMRYVQAYAPRPDPDISPEFEFEVQRFDDVREVLRSNPVERVKEYTDRAVADMLAGGALPAEWRDPAVFLDQVSRLPREEHHERLARALRAHLATDPTFRYTLDLKRVDSKVDPVEDFLFNTKSGHCQRFATALVLMLRSQGIPAVYVRGFKGCEHVGNGRYTVQQEQAHAWVEALVPVPPPAAERAPDGRPHRFHWLSLDPTPDGAGTAKADGWWQAANARIGNWFQHYVVNYTPEQRRNDLAALAARATRADALLGLGGVAAVLVGLRTALRARARRAAHPTGAGPANWFGELVGVLTAHGLVPESGETPLEYATRAEQVLAPRPACAAVAGVPAAWTEAYYQDRFGGEPLSDARRAELRAGLESLRTALNAGGTA